MLDGVAESLAYEVIAALPPSTAAFWGDLAGRPFFLGGIAQLVERRGHNPQIPGPGSATTSHRRTMTRGERAAEMRRRAWELVQARGATVAEGLTQYSAAGMTIEDQVLAGTHRLSVATKAGKVLVAERDSSGELRVFAYTPGLWETRLKHLTRGAL